MSQRNNSEQYSISVVIPAYNVEKYIARAIDSVLAQTRLPDEIIVVDDGSTDNTANIVSKYSSKVKLIRQENAGASLARNTGIEAANGEWIAFLDADDEWLPEKLQLQIDLLKRNPHLAWTTGNFHRCLSDEDRQEPEISEEIVKAFLGGKDYVENYFSAYRAGIIGCTDTMLVKRQILLEAGKFREKLAKAEDLDMWWRIAHRQPAIGYVAQPIAKYYMNLSNISRREYSANLCTEIIQHNMELAKQYNRTKVFEPCAKLLLKQWTRSMLFHAKRQDIRQIMKQFSELLPISYRMSIYILTVCPKLTATCCRIISKVVRSLNLRKGIFRKPARTE